MSTYGPLQYAHGCVVCRSVAKDEAMEIDIPINQRVLKERVDALNWHSNRKGTITSWRFIKARTKVVSSDVLRIMPLDFAGK